MNIFLIEMSPLTECNFHINTIHLVRIDIRLGAAEYDSMFCERPGIARVFLCSGVKPEENKGTDRIL
jgi:hypothetical protein